MKQLIFVVLRQLWNRLRYGSATPYLPPHTPLRMRKTGQSVLWRRLSLSVSLVAISAFPASAQFTFGGKGSASVVVTDSLKRLANGTAAAPSLAFLNSAGAGLYRFGADTLGIAAAGTRSAIIGNGFIGLNDGTAGAPSLRFTNPVDGPTGFYRFAQHEIGLTTNGLGRLRFTSHVYAVSDNALDFGDAASNRPRTYYAATAFRGPAGSAATPVFSRYDDNDTGGYFFGPDTLGWATGGVHSLRVSGGATPTIAGGAGNMTILAGTGNSRTLTLQATSSVGVANTFAIGASDTLKLPGKAIASALTAASGTPNSVCLDATTKQILENAATSCVVSSLRYKKNVRPLAHRTALDIVRTLQPKTFQYKTNNRTAIGLIAEDVYDIDSRLVTRDSTGPNAVNYEQVTVALLAVVQQQQEQINTLIAEVRALKRAR